ncbi:hypothetical protein COTS27_00478 [Spirochaetota bacterium]|nr:hypothetical protein COTS27_00478 [Spirochaetota bacterium]
MAEKYLNQATLKKLKRVFEARSRLAIFMHNHPDPDALASALILQSIAQHFNTHSDIILNGVPNQQENHTMIRLLNIRLAKDSHYTSRRHSLTALVDCQKSMKNHSFPEDRYPDINFDHHFEKTSHSPNQHRFKMINPNVGATASLLMHTLLALKLTVTPKLATAYAYALLSETRYLSREFSKYDIAIYKKIIPKVNFTIIAEIQNTKRPNLFYQILRKALAVHKLRNNLIVCPLGELCQINPPPANASNPSLPKQKTETQNWLNGKLSHLDFVHQIAEEFSKMEDVYLVIVTGVIRVGSKTIGKISLRGEHPDLKLGAWLKRAMKPYGSGGGHHTTAAGNFTCSEQTVIKAVTTMIEKQLSTRLKQKILADLKKTSYHYHAPSSR